MEKDIQQFVMRLDKSLKEDFAEAAKQNGSDSSTEVRGFMQEYVAKNKDAQAIDNMWNAGYAVQQAIGTEQAFIKSRTLIGATTNKFVEDAMVLLVNANVKIPKDLLDVKDKPELKNVFIAGLIGEKE